MQGVSVDPSNGLLGILLNAAGFNKLTNNSLTLLLKSRFVYLAEIKLIEKIK